MEPDQKPIGHKAVEHLNGIFQHISVEECGELLQHANQSTELAALLALEKSVEKGHASPAVRAKLWEVEHRHQKAVEQEILCVFLSKLLSKFLTLNRALYRDIDQIIKRVEVDILDVTNAETLDKTSMLDILSRLRRQVDNVGAITVIPKQVSRDPKGR